MAELDSFFDGLKANETATSDLTRSMSVALPKNPDEMAKATQLGASTGFAPSLIFENTSVKAEAERRDSLGKLNLDSLLQTHPKTANWLSTPDNAALAHDHVPDLQKVEDSVKYLGASEEGRSTGSDLYEIGRQLVGGLVIRTPKMIGAALEWHGTTEAPRMPKQGIDLAAPAQEIKARPWEYGPQAMGKSAKDYWSAKEKEWAPDLESRGIVASTFVEAAGQIGPSALGMAAAVVNPAAALIGISFFFGGQQAQETMDKGTAKGLPPAEVLRAARLAGFIEGLGEGVADVAGGPLVTGAGKLLWGAAKGGVAGAAKAATSPKWAALFAKDWAENALLQSSTEYAQGYGEAAVEKAYGIDKQDPGEVGAAGARIALGMSVLLGVPGAVSHRAVGQQRAKVGALLNDPKASPELRMAAAAYVANDITPLVGEGPAKQWLQQMGQAIQDNHPAAKAEATFEALTKVSEAVVATKLHKRSPEQLKQFIRTMSEDGASEVFVDANKLHDILAQAPIEVQQVFNQEMPEVIRQLNESVDGFVSIPLADYATHIAGTEIDASILQHSKLDLTDELTYAQAQEQYKAAESEMQAEADKLVAERADDAEYQADSQQVYDTLLQRLINTKRFTPDVMRHHAALDHAYYTVLAKDTGLTPSEALARFPLYTQAERTDGAELDQDITPTREEYDRARIESLGMGYTFEVTDGEIHSVGIKGGVQGQKRAKEKKVVRRLDAVSGVVSHEIRHLLDEKYGIHQLVMGLANEKKLVAKLREFLYSKGYTQVGREGFFDTKEAMESLIQQYFNNADELGKVLPDIKEILDLTYLSEHKGIDTPYDKKFPTPSSNYGYRARDAARKAILEDFTQGRVQDLLRQTDWAILTAENPNAEKLSLKENNARNEQLKADLAAFEHIEVNGKYGGNEEHSFAVVGITREQASQLGQKYGQQSVLTREGLVYQDGSISPARGVTAHAVLPEDFYSTVPSTGASFSVDIDFDNKINPVDNKRVGEQQIDAVHFSKVPRETLEGGHVGTGIKAEESVRLASADPRVRQRIDFYWGPNIRPEAGLGPFRHELTLTNMYDGGRNPLRLPYPDGSDGANVFEKAVIDAGFDGYFTSRGRAVLLGKAAESVQVDNPPHKTEYAQALVEVYENEAPTGKLVPQDLADLRKLWSLYTAADSQVSLYGSSAAKAGDISNKDSAFQNIEQIIAEVYALAPEEAPSVKDITRTVEGNNQVPYGSYAFGFYSGGSAADIYINLDAGTMELNVSQWGEGKGGSGIYKVAFEFARNNGLVLYGDSNGITVAGMKRRLEAMLSHAIQSGDTRYMVPHPDQIRFIEQETGVALKWKDGDSKNNVEQMLNASYNLVNLDTPELKNVYFDFTQHSFVDASTGEAVIDLQRFVTKARGNTDLLRRKGTAGTTTLKRTAFSNTLLRARSPEARRLVFDSVAKLALEQLPGAEQLLYQSEVEKPTFYSALTRAIESLPQTEGTPEQWQGWLWEPETTRTVGLRDEKNKPTGKTKIVKVEGKSPLAGVQPMELEWTGVLDWLEARKTAPDLWEVLRDGLAQRVMLGKPDLTGGDEFTLRHIQPSKSVTREDIIDYLKDEGAVTVTPKVYGGEGTVSEFEFSFGDFETEEPDDNYMYERASERVAEMDHQELSDALDYEVERAPRGPEGRPATDLFGANIPPIYDPFIVELSQLISDNQVNRDDTQQEFKNAYQKLLDAKHEDERESYWSNSDSPTSRSISVTAGDNEYDFTHYYSYGEHYVREQSSGGEVSDLGRRPDDASIESAIRSYLENTYNEYEDSESATKFGGYVLPGGENYRERLLLNSTPKYGDFSYTSHFDDENIIGHSRVDDRRVTPDAVVEAFPEMAAKMKAEGRTAARVYFIEEVQSDWAQQGRERPEVQERYKLEDLVVDEVRSAGDVELLKHLEVREVQDEEGRLQYNVFNTKTQSAETNMVRNWIEAEGQRLRMAKAHRWVIEAPGQVFDISKADYPTQKEALDYIVAEKTRTVPGKLNAFETFKKRAKLQLEIEKLRNEQTQLIEGLPVEARTRAENPQVDAISDQIAELRRELDTLGRDKVPPGTFVESTDSWVSLVLKDAIREAAAGGYDLISWTTGDQQIERWSGGLRKQVDTIKWEKSADGHIHIIAMQGSRERANTNYGENDLAAAIGKTMAKRIIEDPNQTGEIKSNQANMQDETWRYREALLNAPISEHAALSEAHQIRLREIGDQVDQLTVTDLGMVKFYGDENGNNPDGKPSIVTKNANKILSKMGGGKVVGAKLNPAYGKLSDNAKTEAVNVQPAFEITDKMREIAMQGQPLFQKNRGTFNPDTMTRSILKDANLTTILHETGHFYLEMEVKLYHLPEVPQARKDRFVKMLNRLGIADVATWERMSFEERRPYHESFARLAEAYFFQGRAPSIALQKAFSSFKDWLVLWYKKMVHLNVTFTDEVSIFFDHLIASEEDIQLAQQRRAMTAANTEAMLPEEKAAYLALDGDASDAAKDELQRRSLRDMKWLANARSKVIKDLQKEAASKRKEVQREVTDEVMAEPINKARTFLRKGEMTAENGDLVKADKGFRLDTAVLAEMYPETMLARPDLTGLRGMTMKEGLHPDLVADMFGLRSGDALVRELIDGEDARAKIEGLTDQRMMERYGDLHDQNAVERAADEAVHNEARARFMATGLKALSESKLPVSQIVAAAKEAADAAIAVKKIRDLKPAMYEAAETKANKEVLKSAAKDTEKAKRAQRSALLNNRLAKAALDALEEVRKGVDRMNRAQKVAAQKNMRGEYLIQLNALLDRFDLRKSMSLKAIDANRTPLAEWLAAESERMSAVMPDIPGWILNEGNRTHYKDLTVEEFRGLVDTMKQLELLARREEKQYQEIRGMKFIEERTAILDRIRQFHPEAFSLDGEPIGMSPKFINNLGDAVKNLGAKFAGEFLNAETIINLLEGGEFGLVHESLFGRMSHRAEWKATRLGEIYRQIAPLFEQYSLKERHAFSRADIGAPIGMSLTRENALVVALLHGNKEGRERLANYGWAVEKQQQIVNLLDERDMKVATGIWDLFDNDLWPELKALNDRTRGKSPPKVEAESVKHGGKTYRGGYFRLKYNTALDERARRLDEGAAVKELLGGGLGMSAKTGQGSSTERKENVTKRPRLDLGVFSEAVAETVHDLAFREAVADTMRMLNDVRVQNTIKTVTGYDARPGKEDAPAYRALVTRVREIAAPPRNPSGFIEKTLTIARKNTIVTLMSGVNTALQNFTGFVSAASRVNPGRLAKEVALFYSPKMAERYEFAMSQSEYMRNRHNSFERDMQNEIKKMTVNASIMPETSSWLALMGLVDKGTSVPVWNTAFSDGMAKFDNDVKKSVDYADHVVRQSQGSGRELDVAQIMSGHGGYGQLKRVFTMFHSFFNAQLGMLVRSGAINARLAKSNPALATARFTKDFMLIYVIPAILTYEVFKGGGDDDPDKWMSKYAHVLAMYGMAMVPLLRDVGSFAWASFDHDVTNYGFKITPVQSAGEGVVKGAVALKDIVEGNGDDKDLKNLIMGTSYAVGLPGKLISDTTLGTKAWLEGEAPPTAAIFGPPKK